MAQINPPISPLLRFLTFIKVLVLFTVGVGLLIVPASASQIWPWELLPFNARFLGAIYAAACVAAVIQLVYARWSPARLVTSMIALFTTIISILSFVYIKNFDFQRWEVWVWFVVYLILPINAIYHLWLYRNLPPVDSTPLSNSTRTILMVQSIVLGLYGLMLIVAPSFAKGIWSWEIDNFHAQVYSVTFLTPAIGSYVLTKGATKLEWTTLGLAQLLLGFLPILGVLIVDATVNRVNYFAIGTWVWFLLFASMGSLGIWMLTNAKGKAT